MENVLGVGPPRPEPVHEVSLGAVVAVRIISLSHRTPKSYDSCPVLITRRPP